MEDFEVWEFVKMRIDEAMRSLAKTMDLVHSAIAEIVTEGSEEERKFYGNELIDIDVRLAEIWDRLDVFSMLVKKKIERLEKPKKKV